MLIDKPIKRILNIKSDFGKATAPQSVTLNFVCCNVEGKLSVRRAVGLGTNDERKVSSNREDPFFRVRAVTKPPLFLYEINIDLIRVECHGVPLIFSIEDETWYLGAYKRGCS